MPGPLRVAAGEVTLRYDGEQYYCDTPPTLHTHDSCEAIRLCIHEHGYATEGHA